MAINHFELPKKIDFGAGVPNSRGIGSGKKELAPDLHASKWPKELAPGKSDSRNWLTSRSNGGNSFRAKRAREPFTYDVHIT